MEVADDCESLYRIQLGSSVKYIAVDCGVFDYANVMSFPPALLLALSPLPDGDWVTMTVRRNSEGTIIKNLDHQPLPEVQSTWHLNFIDVLTLPEIGRKGARVRVVQHENRPAIAKLARFDWEIQYVERETIAYKKLACKGIAPSFLGHLVEENRVMGVLLEKMDGRSANIGDLEICRGLVKQVHDSGLLHGDTNKYNFIVNNNGAWLVDFENSQEYEADLAEQELGILPEQLLEESGRGAR